MTSQFQITLGTFLNARGGSSPLVYQLPVMGFNSSAGLRNPAIITEANPRPYVYLGTTATYSHGYSPGS